MCCVDVPTGQVPEYLKRQKEPDQLAALLQMLQCLLNNKHFAFLEIYVSGVVCSNFVKRNLDLDQTGLFLWDPRCKSGSSRPEFIPIPPRPSVVKRQRTRAWQNVLNHTGLSVSSGNSYIRVDVVESVLVVLVNPVPPPPRHALWKLQPPSSPPTRTHPSSIGCCLH